MRSALAVLMLLEWCVPTCHAAFRQVIAGERWVRKLVDLVRKDATDPVRVRARARVRVRIRVRVRVRVRVR